jgi:hypothetical protein
MNEYSLYVEFFGKHLKCVVQARDEKEAYQLVWQRLHVLKCEKGSPVKTSENNMFNDLWNIVHGNK